MKLNKTFALAAIVAGSLLAGTAVPAQDSTNTPSAGEKHAGNHGGIHGQPNIGAIIKELGLTDDQEAKLKVVLQDQQTKIKALREDTSLSMADKKAKVKAMRDAFVASLKTILTPEQLAKWQQHMQRNHPPGVPGGAPPSASPQP